MLKNSFSLEESSPFTSETATEEGVERLGVEGLEFAFGSTGVVVPEGFPEEGGAEAILSRQ